MDTHHEHREKQHHSKVEEVQEAALAAGEEQVSQLIAEMEQQVSADTSPQAQGLRLSSHILRTPKQYTWALVAFASMGGLLSGLDQSIISGANLFMPDDLGLSTRQNSLVNSGMPLGAVGGALLLSPCNEYLGRRKSIIVACVLYTIGAALEAGSINFAMMVAARLVLGLGVGLEGGTVPVYVAETVERRLRGNLVSFYQFNIALGEVIGYAVGAMFTGVNGGWRYMLGSSVVFSTIMMVGVHGIFFTKAKFWSLTTSGGDYEGLSLMTSVEAEEENVHSGAVNKRFPWLDFFTEPRARRSIVYANIMVFFGQFTGCNAILYYLSVLMNQIGFDKFQSNYMSLVGGGALLLGTIPAVLYMERFGRRFWAISMLPGFFLGLVLIGISYRFDTTTQLPAAEGTYLTGLILYYAFFGSYACLTWVIPSEVYPTYLRSYGMTSSDVTLFLSAFLMTYNFSAMQDSMTPTGLLLGFYGGIAVLAWVYQILFMPETKGKTLEEIDFIFRKPVSAVVRENIANTRQTVSSLMRLQWGQVFAAAPAVQREERPLDESALEKQ
ncbi:fructose symporter [Sporothrix bragantina]|uniref:Fructose symporter n=1 Tax=Sporothrix bragantina TaxID=671064 RepID=A0ABP0CWX3_9PEZI